MSAEYQHLGIFADWVEEASRQKPVCPGASPGLETQRRVREVLGFCSGPETPVDARLEKCWEQDGLIGEEVSWSVGYGPRTVAWIFKPAGARQPLPAVLALHDHGGFKYLGKEKIARGETDPEPYVGDYREIYGSRAYVNALAKEGFVVLAHDTFLWGSRRIPLETIQAALGQSIPPFTPGSAAGDATPLEVKEYNYYAWHEELLIEKYCALLGTTMAGVVSHEDRIAFNYLASRPDVLSQHIGCIGLSGGGNRAALLQATQDNLAATVIVALMSTYEGLLSSHVACHTWMLFPHGWARYGDWPDLAACRAPSPLLVQYDTEDELFTLKGMQDAHHKLSAHYSGTGHPEAYTGQFYPGPHKFDLEMQAAAFAWLKQCLMS